ncbi:hypothetical protein QTP88_022872 [Uroleucon formosanum]
MDIRDDQNHVFNISLAKRTGLYQSLNPETTKYRGKNLYRIVMAFFTLYIGVNGVILNVHGVYYWTNNMSLSIDYFWNGIYTLFICYSLSVIVHYSDDIWNCLSITCYGFTSHSLRDRHILDRWRERSVFITTIITFTYFVSAFIFYFSSLVLWNYRVEVKNRDGSVSNYRYNVLNYYLFVSEETYNAQYYMFNMVECLGMVNFLIALFVFDVLAVTLCLAIRCQMQMISIAFESVGYTSLGDHHLSLVDCRGEKKNLPNIQNLMYDQIKTIIMDHQAVMRKYGAILKIFKGALLSQFVILSMVLIVIWFCFIMSFSSDERFNSSRIITIKIFSAIPITVFKLFGTCYLFGNIHDQKDSIIFALYSSNWPEMDMKCKKLILLAMKMNNANQKKLKFTRTKIINLEMFFKTIRDSYSILSVLVNYIKNMNE